jgi:hypothetical protein
VDLLRAVGWYEASKRREFGCEIWRLIYIVSQCPIMRRASEVYVAMGVVKDIKSVVFFLDNYITRKNLTTNTPVNIVGIIQRHSSPLSGSP